MDAFNVLTEFRFSAGEAILESNKLQHAVEGISDAADKTTLAFQQLGAGLVGHLDLLHGGMIGTLVKSIEVSDQFNLNASTFANIIQANMKHMTGSVDTFNDRLDVSKQILMDIHNIAFKFGLDEKALFGSAQGIAATLSPHGLSGKNFGTAIDMARMSLKAAPALQMEPRNVEQELIRVVTGQANSNETLFRRLVSDTQAMKQYQTLGTGAFNALPIAKRVKILQDALNEFSRDTEVAEFNMKSLHNQLTLLKNAFGGLASILKPFGDLMLPLVQKGLMALNMYLETTARQSIVNLVKAMKPLFDDPQRSLAGIMTLKQLPDDMHKTKKILEFFTSLRLVSWAFDLAGIKVGALTKALHFFDEHIFPEKAAGNFFKTIFETITGEGGGLGAIGKAFLGAAGEVVGAISEILLVLQIFTKGLSYAKIWDVEFIADHMEILTRIFQKFTAIVGHIMAPLNDGIDAIARFIGWIFSFGYVTDKVLTGVDKLLDVFSFIVDGITILLSPLMAFGGVISGLAGIVSGGGFKALQDFNLGDMFHESMDKVFNTKLINGPTTKETQKMIQNVGKIEMRLDFKENMQPDRVAFTIMDQLKKVAQNPSQGRGNTFSTHALTGASTQ